MWRMSNAQALIFIATVVVMVALRERGSGCASRARGFYLMKPHQTAKAPVAKIAVMAIEINNESVANLIQSGTVAISSRHNCHVAVSWEITA
jgi:hypothetical protein